MKRKFNYLKILDYLICILLLFLSIKKGGFYKSDTILFNLGINVIAVIIVIVSYLKKEKKREKSNISILLLMFSLTYLIPVIIKNYSSLNDSIFEMIRYFNLYLIYLIVRKSENKEIYKNCILILAVILVLFGIDQIANGYMSSILSYFNSGYLTSNNIDRMSSTIQYANVFALICLIAYILCLDNVSKHKCNYYINNMIQVILLSGIILSGCRIMLIIAIAVVIYNIIKNKKIKINILLNLIYTFIYTMIINKLITNNLSMIYVVTLVTYVLNIIFSYLIKKYGSTINLYIMKIKNKRFIKYIIILFVIIFVIISFTIHTSIKLNSSSNKSFVTRNIYNFDKTKNNVLQISIDELEEDTRYEIEVFQVDNENNLQLVDKLYYYSTISGNFNIEIIPIENLKYINININCTKGSLKVEDITLNNKQVAMDYLFLPSNLIYRIIDGIYTSNSFNYRITYQKDAFKIATNTLKNFVFGIGGEGFRNEYKYFKSLDYNSTEVHNIYLQILVESGILGLSIFLYIIVYILSKYKLSAEKIALICILIHGIFDLDFSYMIIIALFGVLLGLLEEKEINKNNDKKYIFKCILNKQSISYIENILIISMCVITTGILVFSNIASCIKLYEVTDLDSIESIEAKIVNYEKIVNLDRFEPKYRIKLNEVYSIYLSKIKDGETYEIDRQILVNVLNNMLLNLNYLQNNESENISYLFNISNQYFNNMQSFIFVNYSNNLNEGYENYLQIIYSNMKKLYNCNDEKVKLKAKNICEQYIEVLKKVDNDVTNKYVKLLENMI